MGNSQYTIAALIDPIGRIATSSELVNVYDTSYMYSLTVEKYIWNEDPRHGAKAQLMSHLGIRSTDFDSSLKLVAQGIVNPVIGFSSARDIHLFVYAITEPISMRIFCPKRNPFKFMSLESLKVAHSNKDIFLSNSAGHMLNFLDKRKDGLLKGVLA